MAVMAIALLVVVVIRSAPTSRVPNVVHTVGLNERSEPMGAWTAPESPGQSAIAPASLPPDLQSVIDRRFAAAPGVITPTATGATIDNPAQQIAAVIDGRGLRICEARLAVKAWGRDERDLMPAQAGTVTTTAERVIVQRPGLHEVITTSATGLRHDVVVEERPHGAGDLVVEIGCQGGHFERKNTTGAELVIDGRRMTYDRLKVSDADGKELMARMEVVTGVVRVHVQDAGVRYPVLVDPTISTTGSLSLVRMDHTATLLLSGKILVAGGNNGGGQEASCELYDPGTGMWSVTGSMASARAYHTATVLSSGKVLVTGGAGGNALSSCELYDPVTGTWSATASMTTERYSHSATLMPSGRVLVTGGPNVSCELYNPNNGTWSATGSLVTARTGHVANLLPSGKVLVTGGTGDDGKLTSCELYDPATDSWSETGSLTMIRNAFTATLLPSGEVLVTGGYEGGPLTSCELYDPSVGTWSATGSLRDGRMLHSATLLPSGKVLVAGGYDSWSGFPKSCELYDPTTHGWSRAGQMDLGRYSHSATLLPSGQVVVVGGYNGDMGLLRSCELYLPEVHNWIATGSLNLARFYHTATLLPSGKVLVTGGNDSGTIRQSCELYDPAAGTWAAAASLSTARAEHTATLLPSGKVLVTGGYNGPGGDLVSCELYDPGTDMWSTAASLATGRHGHIATLLPSGKVLVTGGSADDNVGLASCELYDPSMNSWSAAGSMANVRKRHTATLLPTGKVLVAGGYDAIGVALVSCELYDPDPAPGAWSATEPMANGRGYHTATLLPTGTVLVTGGIGLGGALAPCEIYDPGLATWSATGSLITGRYFHTATLLPSGEVLVTSGAGDGSARASCETYDPDSGMWTATGSVAMARTQHTTTLLPSGEVLMTGGFSDYGYQATCELYGRRAAVVIIMPVVEPSWVTTLTALPIAGTADHHLGITTVTYQLSGATAGSGMASGSSAWNFTSMFNPGTTVITVTAEASDGSLLIDTLTVTATRPPTIAISSPTTGDSWLYTGGGVTISGTAGGSGTLTGVTYVLSGATSGSGSATGTSSWTCSPTLNPGITSVTMIATDIDGHAGQDVITITNDVSNPVIAISSPTTGASHLTTMPRVTLIGSAVDDGGIVSITYQLTGATTVSGTASGTTAWSLLTPVLQHGLTTITITAHDVAGRTSVVALDLVYPSTSEVTAGNSAGSCGSGSGLAALLSLMFVGVTRFRRGNPAPADGKNRSAHTLQPKRSWP